MKKYRIKRGKTYLGRVELKKKYHPCHWVALPTEALLMYKPKADKILNHFKDNSMMLEEVNIPKQKKHEIKKVQAKIDFEKFLEYDTGEFGRC